MRDGFIRLSCPLAGTGWESFLQHGLSQHQVMQSTENKGNRACREAEVHCCTQGVWDQNVSCFSGVVYSVGSPRSSFSLAFLDPGAGQAPKAGPTVCLWLPFIIFPHSGKGSWSMGRGPCSHIQHTSSPWKKPKQKHLMSLY